MEDSRFEPGSRGIGKAPRCMHTRRHLPQVRFCRASSSLGNWFGCTQRRYVLKLSKQPMLYEESEQTRCRFFSDGFSTGNRRCAAELNRTLEACLPWISCPPMTLISELATR